MGVGGKLRRLVSAIRPEVPVQVLKYRLLGKCALPNVLLGAKYCHGLSCVLLQVVA